jgi:colicin import membrane protein
MTRKLKKKYPGLGGMLTSSVLLHLLCFFVITRANFLPRFHAIEEKVYYVEMVNLPVAAPQAGSPSASGNEVPPPPPPRDDAAEMKYPGKKPAKPQEKAPAKVDTKKIDPAAAQQPQKGSVPGNQLDAAREFEERLARLERDAESKKLDAAIDALKKKAVAGKGRAGMPAATGKEAGSDYSSYLQSRLKDAFKSTIAFQTKNPQLRVRLTVAKTGRVVRYTIEQSSGDRLFEEAVLRAIARAEKGFTPPPGGVEVEQGFVFRPQGVGIN